MRITQIRARELKLLRACATGIMRHLRLVAETIKEFGEVE